MRKTSKKTEIKSIGFMIIISMLPISLLLILMSIVRSKTVPSICYIFFLLVIFAGIAIDAFIIRKRDMASPERQHEIAKYYINPLVIYLVYFLLIASFDILTNISKAVPVDYNKLPGIFVSVICYILVYTILWVIYMHLAFKCYSALSKKRKMGSENAQLLKASLYFFSVIVFIFMLLALRIFLKNVYEFYNTSYSRYGDIASFLCAFGGLLGAVLVLFTQNKVKFIPFKFLNSLVEMLQDFDTKERKKNDFDNNNK